MRIAYSKVNHRLPSGDDHAHNWTDSQDRRRPGYMLCSVTDCGAYQACEAQAEDGTACRAYASHPGVHRGTNPAGFQISWCAQQAAEPLAVGAEVDAPA